MRIIPPAVYLVVAACGPPPRDLPGSPDARVGDARPTIDSGLADARLDAPPVDAANVVWSEQFGNTTEGPGEVAFPVGYVDALEVTLPAMTVTGLGAIAIGTVADFPERVTLGLYPLGGALLVADSAGQIEIPIGQTIAAVTPTTIPAGTYWIAITGPAGVEIAQLNASSECLVQASSSGLPASLPSGPNTINCGGANLFVVGIPPTVIQ